MTATAPSAEALVVTGERIVAVGDRGLLARFPGAVVEDLGGRTMCPGFIDAHHHLSIAALHPRWGDATGAATVEELMAAAAAQASRDPHSPWVRVAGWDDRAGRVVPHRRDLDALGLARPVVIAHYSLHQAVVCSRALEELGVGRSTPDPVGGWIGRDPDGTPNGLLAERAWSDAHRRSLPPHDDPVRWARAIEALAATLPADGITAVHDPACPPGAEAAYRLLADAGRLPVGVLACPHPAALLAPPDTRRLAGAPTGAGNEQLRVGPLKLFADGGIVPAIDVHLAGRRLTVGALFPGLADHVDAAVARGFRVAVHAIGNAALDHALEVFEAVHRRYGSVDHRFRVEHACLASPAQLQRLAALGGVAVVQPGFLHHLGALVEDMNVDDATWLPFADMQRAGLTLAASSDCPCAFHQPLRTSARGTTRMTASGRVLHSEQAVPFEDWLYAYTAGAAYAGGQEHERGSLAPGLRADLVVLDGQLDADDPPTVAQTWIGGALVYAKEAPPAPA